MENTKINELYSNLSEAIKEALLSGNFEVWGYDNEHTLLSFGYMPAAKVSMNFNNKTAYFNPGVFNVYLSDKEQAILFDLIISGGLKQMIHQKEQQLANVERELNLLKSKLE